MRVEKTFTALLASGTLASFGSAQQISDLLCNTLAAPTSVGNYVTPLNTLSQPDAFFTDDGLNQFKCCDTQPCACPKVGTVVNGFNGTEIALFTFDSITIPENTWLRILGSRPAALLSIGPIIINGTLDSDGGKGSNPGNPGAGGGHGGVTAAVNGFMEPTDGFGPGGGERANKTERRTGSGGGGFVGKGGNGGSYQNGPVYPGGSGGAPYFDESAAAQLTQAGSGGAAGWRQCSLYRCHGGGGGGAILLASKTSIVIGNMGKVTVNGGRGTYGVRPPSPAGGAGGGSGGVILIRSPAIINSGSVEARGGAGGKYGSVNYCWTTRVSGGGGGSGGYISLTAETQSGDGIFNVSGGAAGEGCFSMGDEEPGANGMVTMDVRNICAPLDDPSSEESNEEDSEFSAESESEDEESSEENTKKSNGGKRHHVRGGGAKRERKHERKHL